MRGKNRGTITATVWKQFSAMPRQQMTISISIRSICDSFSLAEAAFSSSPTAR